MEDLKFEYGIENKYNDVTSIISQNHYKDGIIELDGLYNNYFDDHVDGKIKHIKISYIPDKCNSLYIKENTPLKIITSKINIRCELYCVYFISCNINKFYIDMVISQFDDLERTGLLNIFTKIYIEASIDPSLESNFRERIGKISNNININCHKGNTYEYTGIKKVWDLGNILNNENHITSDIEPKNKLILYFHGKGISKMENKFIREKDELNIFKYVINTYKQLLFWFPSMPDIYKSGLYASKKGFIWYNFWWIKSNYIKFLREPIITTNRYYYESWLGYETINYNSNNNSCISLYNDINNNIYNIGTYFDPGYNLFY